MNRCFLQLWEESDRSLGSVSCGCSIHLDKNELDNFLYRIYKNRLGLIPERYDRVVGEPIECFISDGDLYTTLKVRSSMRLSEVQKNNLISTEEIFFKNV